MNVLRHPSIRYVMVSVLAVSLLPWVGSSWTESLLGPSSDARASWLQGQVAEWPSEADREAFNKALSEASSGPLLSAQQYTASVLQAYEAHAPSGHRAAYLFGWSGDADIDALARWLHQQASQWNATAPTPRLFSAGLSVTTTTRVQFDSPATAPHAVLSPLYSAIDRAHTHFEEARWLVRRLVYATPRAP